MEHTDWVGVSVGLLALAVALYAIRDVRKLVRELLMLERNRVWARVLHGDVFKFVDPAAEAALSRSSPEMHEFTMLVRQLEPTLTLDDTQAYANHEVMCLAQAMVEAGLGKWKPFLDEKKIQRIIGEWQTDKNQAVLRNMFGDNLTTLRGDPRKKMIKY